MSTRQPHDNLGLLFLLLQHAILLHLYLLDLESICILLSVLTKRTSTNYYISRTHYPEFKLSSTNIYVRISSKRKPQIVRIIQIQGA